MGSWPDKKLNGVVLRKKKTSGPAQKHKAGPRRVGGEKSKTRLLLLDAAERLMLKEGYAAVTSRRVAGEANVTSQLVHYYFPTMDDLFLALWRRFVSRNVAKQAKALAVPDPLRALWNFTCNAAGTALEVEFMALAHHRKSIRTELARDGDRFRKMQIDVLSQVMRDYGFEGSRFAEVVAVLLSGVSRGMIMEKDLGVSVGHTRTFRFVKQWLDRTSALRKENSARRTQGPLR